MDQTSLVSVIIIFLNAAEFLTEAIESVLAQTYKNWELLFVDDGSSDNSSKIAQHYSTQDPSRIQYLEHEDHRNLGMSASRNLGISKAKGVYVAFLDADDYWLPGRLETHVQLLDTHPEVGMVYGSTKYWYSWVDPVNNRIKDYLPKNRVQEQTLFLPPRLLPLFLGGRVEIPCPCSILVRTEEVQKIGGFENSFRGMYEDQAFYAKMCLSFPILASNDCLALYRQHTNSCSSIAAHSGQIHKMHYAFLSWIEEYCVSHNIQEAGVLQTIRRQKWLYHEESSLYLKGLSYNKIRWIKKWILKVEERLFLRR